MKDFKDLEMKLLFKSIKDSLEKFSEKNVFGRRRIDERLDALFVAVKGLYDLMEIVAETITKDKKEDKEEHKLAALFNEIAKEHEYRAAPPWEQNPFDKPKKRSARNFLRKKKTEEPGKTEKIFYRVVASFPAKKDLELIARKLRKIVKILEDTEFNDARLNIVMENLKNIAISTYDLIEQDGDDLALLPFVLLYALILERLLRDKPFTENSYFYTLHHTIKDLADTLINYLWESLFPTN